MIAICKESSLPWRSSSKKTLLFCVLSTINILLLEQAMWHADVSKSQGFQVWKSHILQTLVEVRSSERQARREGIIGYLVKGTLVRWSCIWKSWIWCWCLWSWICSRNLQSVDVLSHVTLCGTCFALFRSSSIIHAPSDISSSAPWLLDSPTTYWILNNTPQ